LASITQLLVLPESKVATSEAPGAVVLFVPTLDVVDQFELLKQLAPLDPIQYLVTAKLENEYRHASTHTNALTDCRNKKFTKLSGFVVFVFLPIFFLQKVNCQIILKP
jgi:hypothetical protein